MLDDSKLPTMFWTEAVSTACYVLNRVLVTRPHNKTPYELLSGKVPNISHLKPFGCHVTILNTSDHLGKFEGKADEGFLVGYSAHSKAYRVYNLSNKKIEETLNLRYMEDKPTVQGLGHECAMIYDVCIAWSVCGFILMRSIPSGWICVITGVAIVSTSALTHIPIQATDESMAALKYRDEHNRIGFLEKPKGSTDYHQVIDFLLDSHI
ncbi:retrovirus-related pol polyprotein from transposon TNT 1-94, partial [Tanacetum coccineum]